MAGRTLRRPTTAAAVAVALVLSACDDDPSRPDARLEPAAYAAVLAEVMPEPLDGGDVAPVVFVWASVDPAMTLEDQTALIDEFGTDVDLRFVDEYEAALDVELNGRPPREDGTLIGIANVATEPPIELRVEVYLSDDLVTGHRFTLADRDDSWVVTRDEAVEPELLGDDA
jgi:hypothetical protein